MEEKEMQQLTTDKKQHTVNESITETNHMYLIVSEKNSPAHILHTDKKKKWKHIHKQTV